MSLLHAALAFAHQQHLGQSRDGEAALPYLHHALDVCWRARWTAGCTDEEVLSAALLHDVLEEGTAASSDIREQFGEKTASLVVELTRMEPTEAQREGLSKDEIWEMRTALLLDEIKAMSPEAQLIKLCDRLSNLTEAKATRTGKRLQRYVRQSRMILRAIPPASSPSAWAELDALVSSMGG